MMKIQYLIRRLTTSLLCFITLAGLASYSVSAAPVQSVSKSKVIKTAKSGKVNNTATSTFESPDFAFPKTVEADAESHFSRALEARDGVSALRAAIQLNVAETLVSADSFPLSMARYDTIAGTFPSPWCDLAMILKARLYRDIFASKSYIFRNRQLPSEPLPADVMEWSEPMFASTVNKLLKNVMGGRDELAKIKLIEISPLLEDAADAEKAGFTVFDFCVLQASDILRTFKNNDVDDILPLVVNNTPAVSKGKDKAALTALSCIDEAIALSEVEDNLQKHSFWALRKLDELSGDKRSEYLEQCIDKFTATPYCAPFITAYCSTLPSDNDGRRNKLRLLDDYVSRFPDAPGINSVKNMALGLKKKSARVSFSSQMLPEREQTVDLEGENLYKYYLLIVELPVGNAKENYTYADLKSGSVVNVVPVMVPGSVPDAYSEKINIPSLSPGLYAIVPSRSKSISGVLEKSSKVGLNTVNVSSLSVFTVSAGADKGLLYVASADNMMPLPGAEVVLFKRDRGVKSKIGKFITDKEGKIEYSTIGTGRYDYEVKWNNNRLSGILYKQYPQTENNDSFREGSVLTDLALYRPGDEVEFSAILYNRRQHELSFAKDKKINVVLRDANWQNVDTLNLITDRYGRADGKFNIPKRALNGNWGIFIEEKGSQIGSCSFTVADYKAPSFIVKTESKNGASAVAGDSIIFRGQATTYTGMPVAGAKVSYTISYQPGWWRNSGGNASFGGETVTGSDGSFEISVGTEGLKGTPYERGMFTLNGDVTDRSGESVPFDPLRFSLGKLYRISPELSPVVKVSEQEQTFKVNVNDFTGIPTPMQVHYQIVSSDKVVESGSFKSPVFKPALTALASGRYAFKFALDKDAFNLADNGEVVTDSIILWRQSDIHPPVETALWCPESRYVVEEGKKSVDVRIGSSLTPGYVLAVISDSKKYLESRWIKIDNENIEFKFEMPSSSQRYYIDFIAQSNLSNSTKRVEIVPAGQLSELKVIAESFRDKIEPGTKEKWTFSFTMNGTSMSGIPALAVMTDKSLNAIVPFRWRFNPYSTLSWYSPVSIEIGYKFPATNRYNEKITYYKSNESFSVPSFNTYGYSLYGSNSFGSDYIRIRGGRNMMYKMSAAGADTVNINDVTDECAAEEGMVLMEPAVMNMAAKTEGQDAGPGGNMQPDNLNIRNAEMPVAFFMPSLLSDSSGRVDVAFTAPDFIGTWQFQIAGYTPEMRGATLVLDAVSAKSVMAKLNSPRFVRTGDDVVFSAMIYNNTEKTSSVAARIDVINALSGEVLYSAQKDKLTIEPSGSTPFSASFRIPENVEAITLRVVATSDSHSDGEQTIIPVLPATSVINESTTFYMGVGVDSKSLTLPEYKKDASITLTYTGNPVWECLTALPSIVESKSESILSRTDALFANAVGAGLVNKYPVLASAIRAMSAPENEKDSLLVSPLEKNSELKSLLLSETPWVNDAVSETLRMKSLLRFVVGDEAKEAIDSDVKLIADRQNRDGGWGWCPDMNSSPFMTRSVLTQLGSLKNLGFFPSSLRENVSKAVRYLDSYYVELREKLGSDSYSVTDMINYLYARNSFDNLNVSSKFSRLQSEIIKKADKEWKNFDIYNKATAAIVLYRNGREQTASQILESLQQYAVKTPEKGMWFDNVTSDAGLYGPILTNARVLEAYSEIAPASDCVDLLRQWLVLSKQTQDWHGSNQAALVVSTLLSTGSDWNIPVTKPEITLGNKIINIPKTTLLTGSFSVALPAELASGAQLTVAHSENVPAWGGVVARYIAPISESRAVSMPELSVSKSLVTITPSAEGLSASNGELKVGDKVNVTITIKNDRDLDYVAVTDNRAACLEPVEQVSGYEGSDGVWYYKEVRNTVTNLFIPHLPKGTHVLKYDCYVSRSGTYSLGITSAMSQYTPLITASSNGSEITVIALEK